MCENEHKPVTESQGMTSEDSRASSGAEPTDVAADPNTADTQPNATEEREAGKCKTDGLTAPQADENAPNSEQEAANAFAPYADEDMTDDTLPYADDPAEDADADAEEADAQQEATDTARLRHDAGRARRSLMAGVVVLCICCSLLAGCLGVFVGLKMGNTSLTFDAIVRRVKANTASAASDSTVAEVAANARESIVTVQVSEDDATVAATSSGVVVSMESPSVYLIACCAHGVEGYPYIRVRTDGGTDYRAELVGLDWMTDLALLRVTAQDLRVAVPAANTPVMGEYVIVLGNPLGNIGISASFGVVSRESCTVKVNGIVQELMKLDCAVNPGNSGGGVFDMNGQLVGIVTSKITEYEGVRAEGMAFAVPASVAYDVLAALKDSGFVAGRPTLGLKLAPSAGKYEPLTVGEYLFTGEAGSPDLLPGDVLTKASYANARTKDILPTHTSSMDISYTQALANLRALLAEGEVGDELRLTVKRGSDTPHTVTVIIRAATKKADV